MAENLLKNQYPGAPAGPTGPQGPDLVGIPYAIVSIDSSGAGAHTDAALTATPSDVQARPQIRDIRVNPINGKGPIFRSGAWPADGDPETIISEGAVYYEPIDAGTGNYARIKGSRFGIFRIYGALDPHFNSAYAWRVDLAGQYLQNDNAEKTFEIDRAEGKLRAAASLAVGPAGTEARIFSGSGSPEGVVTGRPGDLYLNIVGGAGTSIYTKQSGNETNTGWIGLGAAV